MRCWPWLAVSGWAFVVLGAGAAGCVVGGLLAPRLGSARVAGTQLAMHSLAQLLPWLALGPLLCLFALRPLLGLQRQG